MFNKFNVNGTEIQLVDLNLNWSNQLDTYRAALIKGLENNKNFQIAQIYLGNPSDSNYTGPNAHKYVAVRALYMGSIVTQFGVTHFWLCKDHDNKLIVCDTNGDREYPAGTSTCGFHIAPGDYWVTLECPENVVNQAAEAFAKAA